MTINSNKIKTLEDYRQCVLNTPIKLMMGCLYTSKTHKHQLFYLQVASKHETKTPKIFNKRYDYGCLLGIYSYYLQPMDLGVYTTATTLDVEEIAFNNIELGFMEKFNVNFGDKFNPFRLWMWLQPDKGKFIAAKTDLERKKIALNVLDKAIEAGKLGIVNNVI